MENEPNPRAIIGGNNPPAHLEPPKGFQAAVDQALSECGAATAWLGKREISDQDSADHAARLLRELSATRKRLDTARKKEREPLNHALTAIQERYNPVLTRLDGVIGATKTALAPWLEAREAERAAAAAEARWSSDEAKRDAIEKLRSAGLTDLDARLNAESALEAAKKADRRARKLEKSRANLKTDGRAVGLRSHFEAELDDAQIAFRHYWIARQGKVKALLEALAQADLRRGVRTIPGFKVVERKVTV